MAFRDPGGEPGRAFPLGETCLAGAADEQAPLLAGALAEADAEVVPATQAVIGAVGVLAAEPAEVVQERQLRGTVRALDSSLQGLYNGPWRSATLGGHHRIISDYRNDVALCFSVARSHPRKTWGKTHINRQKQERTVEDGFGFAGGARNTGTNICMNPR